MDKVIWSMAESCSLLCRGNHIFDMIDKWSAPDSWKGENRSIADPGTCHDVL